MKPFVKSTCEQHIFFIESGAGGVRFFLLLLLLLFFSFLPQKFYCRAQTTKMTVLLVNVTRSMTINQSTNITYSYGIILRLEMVRHFSTFDRNTPSNINRVAVNRNNDENENENTVNTTATRLALEAKHQLNVLQKLFKRRIGQELLLKGDIYLKCFQHSM